MTTFTPDPNLVQEHRQWLSAPASQYLRNWEKLLNADPEAAMCEAAVRRLLVENGCQVEPNEDLTGVVQSPDFRCIQAGVPFLVEVTSISIDKATEVTSLPHLLPRGSTRQFYGDLNGAIFHAAKGKTPQIAGRSIPVLVAVGTFHFQASAVCFEKPHLEMLLTGQELITQKIDTTTGDSVGDLHLTTKLRSATFLRPAAGVGMEHARNPVSGMLLCGFGCEPSSIKGILHPSPERLFDRTLLPKVEFCRLKPGYESGSLSTEWI